jgi:hypothetical protein
MSAQNRPYSRHMRRRPSSSILHHRYSMIPPAKTHRQYATICSAKRHETTGSPQLKTAAAAGGALTVTMQLA